MKSNLFALMGGAAFGAFCGLISSKLFVRSQVPKLVHSCLRYSYYARLLSNLDRKQVSRLRDLYEDNKISIERQGGVDL